jgi:hypothetical protein
MIIARQMAYHREHREKYLAYMSAYNKQYYLKNKPPPRPKKEVAVKVKVARVPKPKKEKKPKKEMPSYDYVEPVYELPTKIERGVFVLHFD